MKHNYSESEPFAFWELQKTKFPLLYHCYKRIFCIPATSVPCEQLFSLTGYSLWDRRNKLSPEKLDKIMVIYQYGYNK